MKLKSLAIAVLSATALMAFASTASATTLSVTGATQTGAVTIKTSLASGSPLLILTTGGAFVNTFTFSVLEGHTESPFSGTTVGGAFTTLTFDQGTEGNAVVDTGGTFSIERIGITSNGTVRANGSKITVPSPFGTLTCTFNNTDIGEITGVDSGNAALHINAVVNCGILPSTTWSGTYTITSPDGLTVIA